MSLDSMTDAWHLMFQVQHMGAESIYLQNDLQLWIEQAKKDENSSTHTLVLALYQQRLREFEEKFQPAIVARRSYDTIVLITGHTIKMKTPQGRNDIIGMRPRYVVLL
jgi:hypothetical protein